MPIPPVTDTITGTATPIVSPQTNQPASATDVGSHNIKEKLLKLNEVYYQGFDHGHSTLSHGLSASGPISPEVQAILRKKNEFFVNQQNDITAAIDADFGRYTDLIKSDDFKKAARQHHDSAERVVEKIKQNHKALTAELKTSHDRQKDELEKLFKSVDPVTGRPDFKELKDDQGRVIYTREQTEQLYNDAKNMLEKHQQQQLEKVDQLYQKRRENFLKMYEQAPAQRALANHHDYDYSLRNMADRVNFSNEPIHYMQGSIPGDFENKWYTQNNMNENKQLQQDYAEGKGKLLFKCGKVERGAHGNIVQRTLGLKRDGYAELTYSFQNNIMSGKMTFPGQADPSTKANAFCKSIPHMMGSGFSTFDLGEIGHWGSDNVKKMVKEILKHNPHARIEVPQHLGIDLKKLRTEAATSHAQWRSNNHLGKGGTLDFPDFTTTPVPTQAGATRATPIADPHPPASGIHARSATPSPSADPSLTITRSSGLGRPGGRPI